jgi:hypothetical protein
VLTLSTISLDSRRDLPKVRYATALDWFLLMSFFYCIATLLQFACVHYFTKVVRAPICSSKISFYKEINISTGGFWRNSRGRGRMGRAGASALGRERDRDGERQRGAEAAWIDHLPHLQGEKHSPYCCAIFQYVSTSLKRRHARKLINLI